jgi:hypothetical protein
MFERNLSMEGKGKGRKGKGRVREVGGDKPGATPYKPTSLQAYKPSKPCGHG